MGYRYPAASAMVLLFAAVSVNAAETAVEPLVPVDWNQQSPWNSYLPVLGNDSGDGAYAGCVGTMLAQLMAAYRWPVRFEDALDKSLKTEYVSPVTQTHRERLRCDAASPLEWSELASAPVTWRQKHLAARVTQFADLTLSMVYETGGSTSSIGYGLNANQIPCYESPGVVQTDVLDWTQLGGLIYPSLAAGCPVGAEIKYDGSIAHAIIFDGWRPAATADAAPEVHLNYGWSGNRSGWYALDSLPDTIRAIAPFFRPVPQAQFAPLSGETAAPVLKWDFPEYWTTRGLAGWRIEAFSSAGVAAAEWTDDFSELADSRIATDSQDGQKPVFSVGSGADIHCLLVKSVADIHPKFYTWPQIFVPEADAQLSFRQQPSYTQNQRLTVQIKAGAEPWTDLASGELAAGSTGVETPSVCALAEYAGKPCQLRLRVERGDFDVASGGSGIYDGATTWRLSDWRVGHSRVLAAAGSVAIDSAAARSYAPAAAPEGTVCAWRITPVMASADAVPVVSSPVTTTVRGNPRPAASILSVTDSSGGSLDEDLRRAASPKGRTVLEVQLSAGAEMLPPTCSNMDFITPEDWSIHPAGNDVYALTFTLAGKSAQARKAYTGNCVGITLRARDGAGGFAAREVMLQFVEGTPSEPNPATGELDPGDENGGEGTVPEPDLGGDAAARSATEIAAADGLRLTRFAPGVGLGEDGEWTGWVDNSLRQDAADSGYDWAFAAADAISWWIDNFRRQGGAFDPPAAAAQYAGEDATSDRGYQTAIADAMLAAWERGSYGYKAEFAVRWLMDGTFTDLGENWATLKATEFAGTGLVRAGISTALIPDLSVYCGATTSSYADANTADAVLDGFAAYLLEQLRHGPVLTALSDGSYLVVWGADAVRIGTGSATWRLDKVYYTAPATAGQTLQSASVDAMTVWGSCCPRIGGGEEVVYRTAPLYAYGHANGQVSSGAGTATPDPEPDPEGGGDLVYEPPEDPYIADEDLSSHYGYTIVRDYHHARRMALAEGKALFVLSGADWCSWCSRVKAYLRGVPDFSRDFVVYYASRESSAESPYFHGSLPQFGTFDPRKANPFAGTLQPGGTRVWANAWLSSENGQYDSQRGYSENRIDECIRKARAAWRSELAANPSFTLAGPAKVLVGEAAIYALRAVFPADGTTMTIDHRVRWQIAQGPAVLDGAGVLKATGPGEIVLRAASLDDYAPLELEMTVTAVDSAGVVALTLPERIINLEDEPKPVLLCHAVMDDGTEVAVKPDNWRVELVEGSRVPLSGFELGEDVRPEISAAGVLTYRTVVPVGLGVESVNICNHRLKVTAVRGDQEVSREYVVHGPTQVRPVELELLSSATVAPGAVVRLKVGRIAYTYGDRTMETDDTGMAQYWNNLNALASSYSGDWQVAIPVGFSASGTYSVNVGARKQNGAYTSYTVSPSLIRNIMVNASGEVIERGRYANVTTGYLGAYFPGRTADAALAAEDSDGDGYANWQEFLLGTEPDRADDAFAFTAQHFSAMVADADVNLYYKVMFTVRPERNYIVEAKERWTDEWQPVGSFDAETRTVPEIVNRELADTAKFFRVNVGFTVASGGADYSAERFTPAGMAIAPDAELDLRGATLPLTLTALAMDDYAPGNPTIRIDDGLPEGTCVLRAPAGCARWMALFRPTGAADCRFTVNEAADGYLEVVTERLLPRPLPPASDPAGVYSDSVREQLGAAAERAGLAGDFAVRIRRGDAAGRSPVSADEVNELFECFRNLRIVYDDSTGAMSVNYDFAVSGMRLDASEGGAVAIVALRATSDGEGEGEVDFSDAVGFSLLNASGSGDLPEGISVRQVDGSDGKTPGVCTVPGLRYLRIEFPSADSGANPRLFRIRLDGCDVLQ